MARTNFETLRVFQLAEQLADRVWDVVEAWRPLARDTVGKQLVRAADSIGANIAEGTGRGTYRDNRQYIYVARGSLNETRYWLRRAFARKLLPEASVEPIKTLLDNLGPQLNAYLKSIGSKCPPPRKRPPPK